MLSVYTDSLILEDLEMQSTDKYNSILRLRLRPIFPAVLFAVK